MLPSTTMLMPMKILQPLQPAEQRDQDQEIQGLWSQKVYPRMPAHPIKRKLKNKFLKETKMHEKTPPFNHPKTAQDKRNVPEETEDDVCSKLTNERLLEPCRRWRLTL